MPRFRSYGVVCIARRYVTDSPAEEEHREPRVSAASVPLQVLLQAREIDKLGGGVDETHLSLLRHCAPVTEPRSVSFREAALVQNVLSLGGGILNSENEIENTLAALAVHALIGKLAHDLVGPLGTQLGFLDLLAQSSEGEQEKGYLERASRQSHKLLEVVGRWRDGLGDATELRREPVSGDSVSKLLDCEFSADTKEPVPTALVYAARLCVKWWRSKAVTGSPAATLTSDPDEVTMVLALPGVVAPSFDEPWRPDEASGSGAWDLYLARMLISRAHGRFATTSRDKSCTIELSVPV